MVVHSSPIEDGPKAPGYRAFQGPKPLHGGPVAAHPLTGLAAFFLLGALRAVFGPVGVGRKGRPADGAKVNIKMQVLDKIRM